MLSDEQSNKQEILAFLNGAQDPQEVLSRFCQDQVSPINLSLANKILRTRAQLPGRQFESFEQLTAITGLESGIFLESYLSHPKTDIPVLLLPMKLETRFVDQELWVRIYPDNIMIDRHEPKLSLGELQAGRRYQRANHSVQDSWRELSQRFGPARAAWIVREMKRQPNLADSDLNHSSLTKPSTLCGLPDRFEVFVYRGEALAYQQSGQFISKTRSLTLHAPLPLGLQLEPDGETTNRFSDLYDDNSRWVIDFEQAIKAGMAVKIRLKPEDWGSNTSFSKVIAVGIRTTISREVGLLGELEQLLEHHHYTNGLAFLAKDTPTNNTGRAKSGFSTMEDHDLAFETEVMDATGWDQPRSNAKRLSQALGLQQSIFQHIALAGETTEAFAEEINTALWPATGDYFLRHLLSNVSTTTSLLSKDQLAKVAQHFSRFVRAGGALPAIRIGDQPYGILPVTRFGYFNKERQTWWQASARDHSDQPDTWIKFDTQLHAILTMLGQKYLEWASNPELVPRIRAESSDPDRDLLQVLAMEPVSTSYWTRPFVDERFIAWCLTALRRYAFPDNTFPGSPLGWMMQWDETWRNLRHSTATLLSLLIGIGTSHPEFVQTVDKFDKTALLRILGWGDGQALPLPLLERPEANLPETVDQYLHSLCERLSQDSPETLLRDMLQRALILAKINETQVESPYKAICDLADASLSKLDLDRLFRESLDLCTHRLDAWITSLATQRLEAMRQRSPQGIYLGAYGWVENLSKAEANTSAGYIHTPSAAQSATAAVLHNAYLTHQARTNGQGTAADSNPYRINLTSTRVRHSLNLLEGVRQGQPLGAILGFQFERALHEEHLDQYIDEFRAAFPTVAGKETESKPDEAVEAIAARTVVDGLTLVRWWEKRDRNDITLGNPASVEKVKTILTDSKVRGEVEKLVDALDGISDLLMHEAVYHTVQGNFDRGGAALEAASGNATPPEIESIRTQTSGTSYGNRVCLLFCKGDSSTDQRRRRSLPRPLPPATEVGPRGQAEPVLNAWFGDLLGDLSQIGCGFGFDADGRININRASVADLQEVRELRAIAPQLVDYRQRHGPFTIDHLLNLGGVIQQITGHQIVTVRYLESLRRKITIGTATLHLAHLKIDALDLLYMAATPPAGEATELEQRIAYCVRKAFDLIPEQSVRLQLKNAQGLPYSIGDALELASSVLKSIGGKSYATPASFTLTGFGEDAAFTEHHVFELRRRVETAHDQLRDLVGTLRRNNTPDAMLRVGQFGVSGTIPIAPADPRIQDLKQSTIQTLEKRAEKCLMLREKANAVLTPDPANAHLLGTNQAVAHLVEAMQVLFGESFIVMPLFEPHRPEDFDAALDDQAVHGLTPERIRLWLEQAAPTHAALADLEALLSYVDAWSPAGSAALTPYVAQLLPEGENTLANSRWLALDDQERAMPQMRGTPSRPKGALSIVMLTSSQGVLSMPRPTRLETRVPIWRVGTDFAGLLIDDWNERIPSATVDTSVAFQYNQPNAQAPQCLLLAVPAEHKEVPDVWTTIALKDIILDTMDLYKIRAVDPDAMRGVGALFPALFLPTDPEQPDWAREAFKETIEEWFEQLIQQDKEINFRNEDQLNLYTSVGRDFTHSESGIRFMELTSTGPVPELHIGGFYEQVNSSPITFGWSRLLLTRGSKGIRIVLPDYAPRVDVVLGWRTPNQGCARAPNNSCIVAKDDHDNSLKSKIEVLRGSSSKVRFVEGENGVDYDFSTLFIFAPSIRILEIYGCCALRMIRTYK